MLCFFTFAIYCFLVTLSLAQNVTIDDTNKAIIYNPPDAWTQLKVEYILTIRPMKMTKESNPQSEDTGDRYLQTTSYTRTVNATATFRFKGNARASLSPI